MEATFFDRKCRTITINFKVKIYLKYTSLLVVFFCNCVNEASVLRVKQTLESFEQMLLKVKHGAARPGLNYLSKVSN